MLWLWQELVTNCKILTTGNESAALIFSLLLIHWHHHYKYCTCLIVWINMYLIKFPMARFHKYLHVKYHHFILFYSLCIKYQQSRFTICASIPKYPSTSYVIFLPWFAILCPAFLLPPLFASYFDNHKFIPLGSNYVHPVNEKCPNYLFCNAPSWAMK